MALLMLKVADPLLRHFSSYLQSQEQPEYVPQVWQVWPVSDISISGKTPENFIQALAMWKIVKMIQ